jgi:hypothetical protein
MHTCVAGRGEEMIPIVDFAAVALVGVISGGGKKAFLLGRMPHLDGQFSFSQALLRGNEVEKRSPLDSSRSSCFRLFAIASLTFHNIPTSICASHVCV